MSSIGQKMSGGFFKDCVEQRGNVGSRFRCLYNLQRVDAAESSMTTRSLASTIVLPHISTTLKAWADRSRFREVSGVRVDTPPHASRIQ